LLIRAPQRITVEVSMDEVTIIWADPGFGPGRRRRRFSGVKACCEGNGSFVAESPWERERRD
jgi:hypothetical protein